MSKDFNWKRTFPNSTPQPRRYHTSHAHDGKLITFGGILTNKTVLNNTHLFNPTTSEWTEIEVTGTCPAGRYGHASFMYNNQLYVHGGYDGKIALDDMYRLDIATKKWELLSPSGTIPQPRYFHSGVLYNNKIFIFAGCKTNKIYYKDLYCYDIDLNTWTLVEASNSPRDRAGQMSFIIDSNMYLFGGFGDDGGYTVLRDGYCLNLDDKKEWETIPIVDPTSDQLIDPFPSIARLMSCGVLNKKAYVYGGFDGKRPRKTLHCFDPVNKSWYLCDMWLEIGDNEKDLKAAVGNMHIEPIPRYGHTTTIIDGQIIIFGGSGSTYLGDVFIISNT